MAPRDVLAFVRDGDDEDAARADGHGSGSHAGLNLTAGIAYRMPMTHTAAPAADAKLTTSTFRVVVEPDDDVWHAYRPALKPYGAATWGATRAEALKHIREVVELVVAERREDGLDVPSDVQVSDGTLVSVIVRATPTGRARARQISQLAAS